MPVRVGLTAHTEVIVTESMTASAVGSGLVAGLSTPAMLTLMEGVAVQAVSPHLDAGLSTVGSRVDVAHLAPTPVGMRVRAEAVLQEVEGRRLVFAVSVADEIGQVGMGTHERYIIDLARFEERLKARGAQD